MSETTSLAGTESDPDLDEIEPEDPDDLAEFTAPEAATDVPGGMIEDDTGFLEDVGIFTHLDDDDTGPFERDPSGTRGGVA